MAKLNIGLFICVMSGHKWFYDFDGPPKRKCKICNKKQKHKKEHNSYLHYGSEELWENE